MVGTLERTQQTAPPLPDAADPPRPTRGTSRRSATWLNTLAPLAAFALLIVVWKIVVIIGGYPAFLLPPPEAVARVVRGMRCGAASSGRTSARH